MGFVGNGSNIAMAGNPYHLVYRIVNIKRFMKFLYLISVMQNKMFRLKCSDNMFVMFRFLDVQTNLDPLRRVPAVCRILCSNVRGLDGNLSDLTVASSQYDLPLRSETLVSDMRHVSKLLVPGFGNPTCLVMPGQDTSGPRDGCMYEMATEHFANPNLSVVVGNARF